MTNQKNISSSNLITKLMALWAVSESGLGGIFHAMKLPFTGLILGSFAVMIVTFIALNSEKKFRAILQATLIVILIKAIASPHSPFTAYVAVMFQGVIGAVIYSLFKVSTFSAVLYGIIALLESALQKLLMMVLIFGVNIWEAFQEFFQGLAKQFNMQSLVHLPWLIVGIYCFAYLIGGILAGISAVKLPEAIQKEALQIRDETIDFDETNSTPKKRKSKTRFIGLAFILFFIVTVFVFSGSLNKAMYALLRTLGAIVLLFFVVNPLFKYLLGRWKDSQKLKKQKQLNNVLEFVPEFKSYAGKARIIASQETSNYRKLRKFVLTWMALALYHQEEPDQ